MKKLRERGLGLMLALIMTVGVSQTALADQAFLPPLHVDGTKLRDSLGQETTLQIIGLDDNMEGSYRNPTTGQYIMSEVDFQSRLSWLHTKDDFAIIKSLGFNGVRLNLGEKHFEGDMPRIRQLLEWAATNNLYVVLTYAPPPGSIQAAGYYSDAPFWACLRTDGPRCELVRRYIEQFTHLLDVVAPYDGVILEPVNEPQVEAYDKANPSHDNPELYGNFITSLAEIMAQKGDMHLLLVDGMSYATPDFAQYSFLEKIKGSFDNIVLAGHIYLNDISYIGSSWDIPSCANYKKYRKFLDTPPGPQVGTIPFKREEIAGAPANPTLAISTWKQTGKIMIDRVRIRDENGTVVFSEEFDDKTLFRHALVGGNWTLDPLLSSSNDCTGFSNTDCSMILVDAATPGLSWTADFGGQWGSAPSSSIYTENGQLVIEHTSSPAWILRDYDKVWASVVSKAWYAPNGWGAQRPQITLEFDKNYFLEIVINGDQVDDIGGITVYFDQSAGDSPQAPFWADGNDRIIKNVCYNAPKCVELRLSSDSDRIAAEVKTFAAISKLHNLPIILNEFGVSAKTPIADQLKYFDAVTDAVEDTGLSGWGYHDYREPASNLPGPYNSDQITLGLFSGWGASVSALMQGDVSTQFGASDFYYRKDFVKHLASKLGGTMPVFGKTKAPKIMSVSAGSMAGSCTINWLPETNYGINYFVEDASNPLFSENVKSLSAGSLLGITIPGQTTGNHYYRVKAKKEGSDFSPWLIADNSCAVPGKTQSPTPVDLIVPSQASGGDGSFTVSWSMPPTSVRYRFVVEQSLDVEFKKDRRVVYYGYESSKLLKRKPGIYFYRVKAVRSQVRDSSWVVASNGVLVQ